MSKMRKMIVRFARAHQYWYTHQGDTTACEKADSLQKRTWYLINQFGTENEGAAFMQAKRRTMQMIPSRGTV